MARSERLTIESNRLLGGIGACLTVIGAVSQVSALFQYTFPTSGVANLGFTAVSGIVGALSLVSFILFLVAMYGFSKDYGENRIFDYILYGLIITIVVAVIAVIILVLIIFSNLAGIIPSLNPSTASSSQITSAMLKSIVPILPVFGVVGLIWVVFNVRAFNLLADKSKVTLFRTAAKVLLAGALLSIMLGIIFAVIASYVSISLSTLLIIMIPGGLVQDAAWALLAMAYFRIKAPQSPALTPPNVPTVSGQVKYCPNCGAQNQIDALYCTRYGQKL